MTFSVKYRTKNGSIAEEVIEAADRSDCFAKCKARGIAVVELKVDSGKRRVESGKLRVDSANPGKHSPTRHTRHARPVGRSPGAKLLIAIGSIAIICAGIWFFAKRGNEPKTAREISRSRVDITIPESPKKHKTNAAPRQLPSANITHTNLQHDTETYGSFAGKKVNKKIKIMASRRSRNPNRKRLFTNHVMCELQHYIIPGRDMPPPDKITNEQALEAADMKIEYLDSDTDEELERKKAVEEMLQEMKRFITEGGSANDFMHRLAARQELEAQAVDETRRNVRALMREGKKDEARAALSAYNEYLKSKGIPEVYVKGLE